MNLQQIENTLYDRLGFDIANPETVVTTRLRRYVNDTYRRILGTRGCGKLRRRTLTFSSVASSPYAVLPQAATNLYTIQDRTNNWLLDPWTLNDLRGRDPGLTSGTANPYAFVVVNYASPVAKQPADASELFAKSDAASDGATKTVQLEGLTTGGYTRTASVAMNGTTAVSLGATITSWTDVTKFYLAPSSGTTLVTAAGNVTLHEDSGAGTELARITIGRAFPRYTLLHLYPTPATAQTYYADVDLHIEDMSSLADEPLLPEDFHWILVEGALEMEFVRLGRTEDARDRRSVIKGGVSDMKLFLRRKGGNPMPRDMRFSQLGSYYEPGT